MAPSTILTPRHWRHVGIYPSADDERLCDLGGFASRQLWLPGDLKALKLPAKSKTTALSLAEALDLGQQIEDAMCGVGPQKKKDRPEFSDIRPSPAKVARQESFF